MAFLKEEQPRRGEPQAIADGISRIVANNPSVMTYWGTNTYLIDTPEGVIVIDPGPEDASHTAAVLSAAHRVAMILITHTHSDHLGGTAALKALTGAPTCSFYHSAELAFSPDVPLKHGDVIADMTVLHTPGHAKDHLCFARSDGILFSGDHVMSWSSSIVSPPNGNMADYCSGLRLLIEWGTGELYLPGHGPPLPDPRPFVSELLAHRERREAEILAALHDGPVGPWELADRLYSKADPRLQKAAERNVLAHLLKLEEEGRARQEADDLWISAA